MDPATAAVGTTDRYLITRLGALCFLLSTIEYMIPKPLPFLRIGLANIPVMLAISLLSFRSFSLLVLIKIAGQALIGGTLFSWIMVFSIAGTVSSAAAMYSLKKIFRNHISFVGICVAGAFCSNAAQLFLARVFIFGESARLVAPPFLLAGVVTGTALGIFANKFARESRWYAAARNGILTHVSTTTNTEKTRSKQGIIQIFFGIALTITLLFSKSLYLTAGIAVLSVVLVTSSSLRIRILPPLLTVSGIILFNLLVPFGRVLIEIPHFPVTEGALLTGIEKALVFEGLLFLSRWTLSVSDISTVFHSGIMADLFSFLAVLTNGRKKINRKNIIGSIDALMFEHV